MYTLAYCSDFSLESGIFDCPVSSEIKSDLRTPAPSSGRDFSLTPAKGKSEASTSFAFIGGQQNQQGSTSLYWWSPNKASSSEQEEKGRSSPVEGVVQPGALITFPPPGEVVRPEMQMKSLPAGNLNEEEWGPRDADWTHILYRVPLLFYELEFHLRALSTNGMQMNEVLIVGVKPLDPMQQQALNERVNNQGFMALPPPSSRTSEPNSLGASPSAYYLQNGNKSAWQSGGAIASPTKSIVSKIMDLMFGI